MKSFTKNETISVVLILLIVGAFTLTGLIASIRRARDAQRMADLGSIANAVEQFHEEYGFFPTAENGQIKACKGENFDSAIQQIKDQNKFDRDILESGLRPCIWGEDKLQDLVDESRNPYITVLPIDPKHKEGRSYMYISNGKRYQILASLEGKNEEDFYDPKVDAREIACGSSICNVGKSFSTTPLDRSLDQYEQELIEKAGKK